MLSVKKKFEFCYGHHLPDYQGDCANVHGHNSEVWVEFSPDYRLSDKLSGCVFSERAGYPGMLIDFKEIKEAVGPIIDQLDHQDLNKILAHPPTAENILIWIRERIIANTNLGGYLSSISVSETPDSIAVWRRS